jgi:hypothetical protein
MQPKVNFSVILPGSIDTEMHNVVIDTSEGEYDEE